MATGVFAGIADSIEIDPLANLPRFHPRRYNLPDLKGSEFKRRKGELWGTLYYRRAMVVREFVEGNLRAIKGTRSDPIILFPEQLEFVTDCFYGRDCHGNKVRKTLLWKSRGGGGSLCAAIVIFMRMVWDGWPFIDMAGAQEQAKQVYEYTTHFWTCVDGLEDLLDGEPRQTFTKLKSGASLKCIAASEKQSRSKHVPGFTADEACQKDAKVGEYMKTAMQGVFSEKDYLVTLLSTFHVATGYFQEMWDTAEQQGYKRYYWNVFHTMQKCTKGLEEATAKDPQALNYCRNKCELTRKVPRFDEDGELTHWDYLWCNGTARESEGFQSYENVLDAKRSNEGTEDFHVEFAGNRPISSGPVYNSVDVARAFVSMAPKFSHTQEKALGIDWGFVGQTALVGPLHFNGVEIVCPRTTFLSSVGLEDTIAILDQLKAKFGGFVVYADSSHKYNNDELAKRGWEVEEVSFQRWKEWGIGNIARWLAKGKLKLDESDPGNQKLRSQMYRYFRDENGKPKKQNDHGPDSLLCGMLRWFFLDYFTDDSQDDADLGNGEVEEDSFVW